MPIAEVTEEMLAEARAIQRRNRGDGYWDRDSRPGDEALPAAHELTLDNASRELLVQWRWAGSWFSRAVVGRDGRTIPAQNLPGLHETGGYYRTCIVHALLNEGIGIQVRIGDLAAFQRRHPGRDRLTVEGTPPQLVQTLHTPRQRYTITTDWQEFHALFANELDARQLAERDLGAPYTDEEWREEVGQHGEVGQKYRKFPVPASRFLEFRMAGDLAPGETPSGLLANTGAPSLDDQQALLAMLAEMQAKIDALEAAQTVNLGGQEFPLAPGTKVEPEIHPEPSGAGAPKAGAPGRK